MNEIATLLNEHREKEITHRSRYFRVLDELGVNMRGWVDALRIWAPYLPVEFHSNTAPLFHESSELLDEFKECLCDVGDDMEILCNILGKISEGIKDD